MLVNSLETLQTTLVAEHSQSRGMFVELAHIESLLAETYRDRIQYELLQNSDDAGATEVNITIHPDGTVVWANNGRPFNAVDTEALCRSASSSKSRGDSIGYRGIGFKSLAAVASRVEVRSAGVRFAFDRENSVILLGRGGHNPDPIDIPLIRIPTEISKEDVRDGAIFVITPQHPAVPVLGEFASMSLLFLRHVRTINVTRNGRTNSITAERQRDRVHVSSNGNDAEFAILPEGRSTVAIPLNDAALSMSTLRGRLACFLPLNDQLGIPLIVSGDLLTDPSRSHAVVTASTTQECLADSARAFASQLSDPGQPWFERCWNLLTMAEDPRSVLASGTNGVDNAFVSHLRDYLKAAKLTFAVSPIPLSAKDLPKIFRSGAPTVLYRTENLTAARALRAAFGLPSMDVAKQIKSAGPSLMPETIESARHYVEQLVKALGRQPNEDESYFLGNKESSSISIAPALPDPKPFVAHTKGPEFPEVAAKWRNAELAVLDWLNSRGWTLTDVSKQNLGYDLVGSDTEGNRTMLEIKRVERLNSPFAMTNNEMGAVHSESGRYLLGIVIGDGRYSQFMLLDPTDKAVPRERVCRAWEWQFLDWSRHGTYLT